MEFVNQDSFARAAATTVPCAQLAPIARKAVAFLFYVLLEPIVIQKACTTLRCASNVTLESFVTNRDCWSHQDSAWKDSIACLAPLLQNHRRVSVLQGDTVQWEVLIQFLAQQELSILITAVAVHLPVLPALQVIIAKESAILGQMDLVMQDISVLVDLIHAARSML